MADIVVSTKPVTRQKLAQFLPNHELVKSLENLTRDVGTVLPDAANAQATEISDLHDTTELLQSQISVLRLRVSNLETQVAALQDAIPDVDSLIAQVNMQRSALANALQSIDDIEKGPRP